MARGGNVSVRNGRPRLTIRNWFGRYRTAVNGPATEESKRWQEICGLDEIPEQAGTAPGWGVSRSRCSVLANRSMPLTIRSRAAMRTCCHAVFLAMRRVSGGYLAAL